MRKDYSGKNDDASIRYHYSIKNINGGDAFLISKQSYEKIIVFSIKYNALLLK